MLENALLLSMGIQGAGMGFSAMSEISAGRTKQGIYGANAKVLKQEAEAEKEKGRDEASILRERANELLSSQIAKAGAGGGNLSGSNLVVMSSDAFKAEQDAQRALYNANVAARGLRNQANVQTAYGQAARRTGNIRAMTTLIQGASNMIPLYYSYGQMTQKPEIRLGSYGTGGYHQP